MQVPAETRDVSVLQCVQTGCGAHPAFYSVGTRGSFSGGWNTQTMKLTIYLYLMLRLRMIGVIPPFQAFTASTGTTLPFTTKCNIQTAIYTSHESRHIAAYPVMMCFHTKNVSIQHYLIQVSVILLILHNHHVNITGSWKLKVHRYGTTFRSICLYYIIKKKPIC
jgi:hypothetical protein